MEQPIKWMAMTAYRLCEESVPSWSRSVLVMASRSNQWMRICRAPCANDYHLLIVVPEFMITMDEDTVRKFMQYAVHKALKQERIDLGLEEDHGTITPGFSSRPARQYVRGSGNRTGKTR